ncbi:MAG: sialidase family protein [Gemmatimonadaceae bacterium]
MGAALVALGTLAACSENAPTRSSAVRTPGRAQLAANGAFVVNVTNDTTAQNETPLAINPANPLNMVVGGNDWNYNDGCSVNATFDGGKTWTPTLPNGFIPGVTKYTNFVNIPGTGPGIFGGDPAVAFTPDGKRVYYACYTYEVTANSSLRAQLLLSWSDDGGQTWRKGGTEEPLTLVAQWDNAVGITKGSNGQFQDHESIHIARDGTIYITWAQFSGSSAHSPVYVATSRDGVVFSAPTQITAGTVRNNQDQRIVTNTDGSVAYLTFDNGLQGGKGTVFFVSTSPDRGLTWSSPVQFASLVNPVCLFPPYCFNVSGGQFRGPGSYPVPAFNPVNNRLYVAFTDIRGPFAQIYLTSAPAATATNPTAWSQPVAVLPSTTGDRLNVEMSIEQATGRIDMMSEDRSYSKNALVDVTYLTSSDGGQTFSAQRVTADGYDPSQYGVPGGGTIRPFIGDYNGIVSFANGAGFTWTGPGKTYGSLPDNLEIYFGKVGQ